MRRRDYGPAPIELGCERREIRRAAGPSRRPQSEGAGAGAEHRVAPSSVAGSQCRSARREEIPRLSRGDLRPHSRMAPAVTWLESCGLLHQRLPTAGSAEGVRSEKPADVRSAATEAVGATPADFIDGVSRRARPPAGAGAPSSTECSPRARAHPALGLTV